MLVSKLTSHYDSKLVLLTHRRFRMRSTEMCDTVNILISSVVASAIATEN